MRLGTFLAAATLLSVAACAPYPPPGPPVAYVPAPANPSGTTQQQPAQPVAAPAYAYGYWGGYPYAVDPWCYWDDWCGWDPWWGFGGFAFIGHFHHHGHGHGHFHHGFGHRGGGFGHHR